MKRTVFSKILCLLLTAVLFAGLCVPANAAGKTTYGKATELETGNYTLVVSGITPTGMASGDYYVSDKTANNPGFLFAAFDESKPDGATVWKITKISEGKCTIQNESKGENGYINLGANNQIGYGAKQELNYLQTAGKFCFYVTVGGTNWYIRFTNSHLSESRFQSGTGEASHQFSLYGNITEEPAAPELDIPPVTGDPIFTMACISDLHADYGLQNQNPFIRWSVIKTLDRISEEENADILLVGGDNTSDNAKTGGWSYDVYQKVIEQYSDVASDATESGRSLWAGGNHDYQVGVKEHYDSYEGFVDIMSDSCGEPLAILRQKDDKSLSQAFPEYVLGLHYKIDEFDIIVINAPYGQGLYFSPSTTSWLESRLTEIGKERTTFIVSHYPLTDNRGISTPTYGISGDSYNRLTAVLRKFPNSIYLYGHNHGGADSVFITDDTFERITSYTAGGKVVNDRNVVPTSFITAFMGSMSFYRNSYNPDWLDEKDPKVVQALMVYVYNDRIVFQMKNYGETFADVTPASWTVMRDIESSLSAAPGSSGEDPSEGDTDNAVTEGMLVTTGVNKNVKYSSTSGILKKDVTGTEYLKYGTVVTANGIPATAQLTTKNLYSTAGEKYDALKTALDAVVTDFAAFEYELKDGKTVLSVDSPVKIKTTLKAELLGPYTDEMTLAVYYLDGEGKLWMTDLQQNEDGSVSFVLPALTPFAVSARANVEDLKLDGEKEEEEKPFFNTVTVVFAVAGGVLVIAGLSIAAVVVLRIRKKAHAEAAAVEAAEAEQPKE